MTLLVILKELQVLILSTFSWANEVTKYQSKVQKAQSEPSLCHKSNQWALSTQGWSRNWDSKAVQLRAGLQGCAPHCTAHAAHLPDEVVSSISVCRHLPSIRCPLVQAPGPWRVRPAWRFIPVAAILENVEGKRQGGKKVISLLYFVWFTWHPSTFIVVKYRIKTQAREQRLADLCTYMLFFQSVERYTVISVFWLVNLSFSISPTYTVLIFSGF